MSERGLDDAAAAIEPLATDTATIAAERGFDLDGRSLREHAARGTMINTAFTVGLNTLGLLRGFIVAAFLTPHDYGVWGVIVIALGTLTWLKQVGFSEKYVQQDEEDQEVAFQKAFTLEAIANALLLVLLLGAIPVAVALYGQSEIVLPALVVAAVVPALVLQTPIWTYYRRMDFVRQRTMQAVDPLVGFVVAVVLAAAGAGYWAFAASLLAGGWANAIVVIRNSPYPLRFRWDPATFKEYLSFSWPLFAQSIGGVVLAQGTIVVASRSLGLAAVGAINLATSFSAYAHRIDEIITSTLYPAICAVKERLDVLAETFVKSNRLTLMWGMPFGIGLALFVPDLIHYVIGRRWDFGIHVMEATGFVAAINHIGFNWAAYHRALNVTKPMAVSAWANVATFAAIPIPLMLAYGLDGYSVGLLSSALVQLAMRGYYMRRLFQGFTMWRHALRSIMPTVPAAAMVLVFRAVDPMHRTPALAIGELVAYVLVTVAATWMLEKTLLLEAVGYLRRRRGAAVAPA